MIKDAVIYKLTVEGHDGLIIKFNSEKPENLIGDRSLYGVEDSQLIEQIKAKPFILKRNLHVLITYEGEDYEFVI